MYRYVYTRNIHAYAYIFFIHHEYICTYHVEACTHMFETARR